MLGPGGGMARDYKSFSSVAKPRFLGVAQELGFEQVTGTRYIRKKRGWYDTFSLQASSYGNDFFFINYGIAVPQLWEPFATAIDTRRMGADLSRRLYNNERQGFPNGTKKEIEESAHVALQKLKEQASPWFDQFVTLVDVFDAIYAEYPPSVGEIGKFGYLSSLSIARYGLFLYQICRYIDALVWLREAERLYAAPKWITRHGEVTFKIEKYAREYTPEEEKLQQLNIIREVISAIFEKRASRNYEGLNRSIS
jgi:hypothetical protein